MKFTELPCKDYAALLASNKPVPGGGGAAALVGALASALGEMVVNLTVGKKKYAAAEKELLALRERCASAREALLRLSEQDAEDFAPLAAAYALPADAPGRADILESATLRACDAPMKMLRACAEVISYAERLAEIGSTLVLSDAACAAALAGGAMKSASLNVFINTKALKDRAQAEKLEKEADALLETWLPRADKVYTAIVKSFREG